MNPAFNPFFNAGMKIRNVYEYPNEHFNNVKKGYNFSENEEDKRLSTYPPGLPVFYRTLYLVANSSPSFSKPLSMLAKSGFSEEIGLEDISSLNEGVLATGALDVIIKLICLSFLPILVYLIGMEFTELRNGLMAAILTVLVTSFHVYASTADILFVFLSSLCIYLCLLGLKRKAGYLLLISGFMLSFFCFLSFAFTPICFFCFILILTRYIVLDRSLFIKQIAFFILGFVIQAIIFFQLFAYNAFLMFFTAMRNNVEYYGISGRSRLPFMFWNPVEFALFLGVPVFVMMLFSFYESLNQVSLSNFKEKLFEVSFSFKVAAFVVFAILLLAGGVRGEVSRNCMLLMPIAILVAVCQKELSEKLFYSISVLMGLFLIIESVNIEFTFVFWVKNLLSCIFHEKSLESYINVLKTMCYV